MTEPLAAPTLIFDAGTLLLRGLKLDAAKSLLDGSVWRWDWRVGGWRADAIHLAETEQLFRAAGLPLHVDIPTPRAVAWPLIALPPPRPQQEEAVAGWLAAGGRGVIVMPTGTGKTVVALAIMARTWVATLVVSPTRDLMHQWHRRILRAMGYDAGVLGDNTFDLRPVTVTTYDSAAIHMPKIGAKFGLIVFDEAHHLPAPGYREAALMCTAPRRLGLTATPERPDGRHVDLDRLIGPVCCQCDLADAGDSLAPYETYRISVKLTEAEKQKHDWASTIVRNYVLARRRDVPGYEWKDVLADAGADPEARRAQHAFYEKQSLEDRAQEKFRALEELFRRHRGERVIVFTGTNAMALEVSTRFLLPTLLSHCRKKERIAVLEHFAAGRFPAIVANQVLDEGVDVPEAKVAVVLGGQSSTRQAKQRLGRILRPVGDARAVLYEVVCEAAGEEQRSRARRKSDAYTRTRHRRI
jgi:superfamily II DNA or RNA helicase